MNVVISTDPNIWINQLTGCLIDFISFVDKRNKDEPYIYWWSDFVAGLNAVKLSKPEMNTDEKLKSNLISFYNRLLPTLYLIRHGLDKDINNDVDLSEHLLKFNHKRKLFLLKKHHI